jgi:signal transduction histidine kinase
MDQEILDGAMALGRSTLVSLDEYDSASGRISRAEVAGSGTALSRKVSDQAERAAPIAAVVPRSFPLAANPWLLPVWTEGKAVDISWQQYNDAAVDATLVDNFAKILGLAHSLVFPLMVHGKVVRALGFHDPTAFSVEDRQICQLYVRQTELALENTRLLVEFRRVRQQSTTSEERLRREIAEFLHSRVQSKLLVVWHRLAEVQALIESEPPRAIQLLASLREELDRIREDDVRHASHMLHPSIIRVGLIPAVRSLATYFEDYFRVTVDFDDRVATLDNPLNNRISEPARLAAYRVIEEALANVLRHARAGLVEVYLGVQSPDRLMIVVGDDGVGFDPATLRPGLGLASISERVEQLDGTCELLGRPGGGATLRATLSLRNPAGQAE